ncbi:MAG: hypothetical protein KDK51_10915 [Deltaproteobacteria bacterium]|nr:hypothetical protein [Deltaproteobacteria bacterium]
MGIKSRHIFLPVFTLFCSVAALAQATENQEYLACSVDVITLQEPPLAAASAAYAAYIEQKHVRKNFRIKAATSESVEITLEDLQLATAFDIYERDAWKNIVDMLEVSAIVDITFDQEYIDEIYVEGCQGHSSLICYSSYIANEMAIAPITIISPRGSRLGLALHGNCQLVSPKKDTNILMQYNPYALLSKGLLQFVIDDEN